MKGCEGDPDHGRLWNFSESVQAPPTTRLILGSMMSNLGIPNVMQTELLALGIDYRHVLCDRTAAHRSSVEHGTSRQQGGSRA